MPCNDGGTSGYYWIPSEGTVAKKEYDTVKQRLDLVTRLLCALMGRIEDCIGSKMLDGRQAMAAKLIEDPELQTWWEEHQRLDKLAKDFAQNLRVREEHQQLKTAHEELNQRVEQIKKLGGTPTPKLRMAHETARQALEDFEAANPQLVAVRPKKKSKK